MKKSPTRFIRRVDNKFTSASLDLNFQNMTPSSFDSRITFTRASNATYFDGSGILQTASTNVPRLDHSPTTRLPLGLLIEEQRTNLALESETFNQASWVKNAVTITQNSAVAPDGTTSADLLLNNTIDTTHYTTQSIALADNTTYAYSVFLKADTATFAYLRFRNKANSFVRNVYVDLTSGTFASGEAAGDTITNIGNGWYRCSILCASSTGATTPSIWIYVSTGVGDQGNTESVGIYAWGAQLEAGAFPTSYIPTTTAAATRNADVATMTGTNFSSWYNQSEGTVFVNVISAPVNTIVQRYFTISDGTVSNVIFGRRTTIGRSQVAVTTGTTQGDINSGSAIAGGESFKTAFAYQVDNLAISTNANTVGTDTSAVIPVVTFMNIGSSDAATQLLNGHIRRIAYWGVRLDNSKLQALTT